MTTFLIASIIVLGVLAMWIKKKSSDLTIEFNKSVIDVLDIHAELHKMTKFQMEKLELEIQYLKEKL